MSTATVYIHGVQEQGVPTLVPTGFIGSKLVGGRDVARAVQVVRPPRAAIKGAAKWTLELSNYFCVQQNFKLLRKIKVNSIKVIIFFEVGIFFRDDRYCSSRASET
jgi:hypothetical protein